MGISLANEAEISIFSSTFPHLALGGALEAIAVESLKITLSYGKPLYLAFDSSWIISAKRLFHML